MSCGVGCRCSSDLVLLWLWSKPAATTPIGPLAWEPPYAVGVALKKKNYNGVVIYNKMNYSRYLKEAEVIHVQIWESVPWNGNREKEF